MGQSAKYLHVLLALILLSPDLALPVSGPQQKRNELLTSARSLYAKGDWNALVELIPASPHNPAELDFLRGMALARRGDFDEARRFLEIGARKARSDKRFPQELAGLAFRRKSLSESRHQLSRALRLDPQDSYTLDFLGSVFLLEGNLEASLKFWNFVDKPLIEEIRIDPSPRLKPELLDHAFQFSPASLLRLKDLVLTRDNLDQVGVFSSYRFELVPRQDARYDLVFRPVERHGLGDGLLDSLVSVFRGTPAQTIYLEAYNLRARAINSLSLYRWHAQKRRFFSSLSGVWHDNPRWTYRGWGDLRKENWDLSRIYQGAIPLAGDLRLRTQQGGFEFHHLASEHWQWSSGVDLGHRRYENPPAQSPGSDRLFTSRYFVKYQTGIGSRLISRPDYQFEVKSSTRAEVAGQFGSAGFAYSRLRGDLVAH